MHCRHSLLTGALRKPSTPWPTFFGTIIIIITATRIRIATFDATWDLLGLAALFVGYDFQHGAAHPIDVLSLQAIAMVGLRSSRGDRTDIGGDVGAYLVAAGLLGHAAWDVYHHWVNTVVVRSMAEFRCILDTPLAVAIVIAAVRG